MRVRKAIVLLGSIPALILGGFIAWPHMEFFMMTGNLFPVRRIETLRNPVAVSGWSSEGLRLADGRTVQLPGIRTLPNASDALTEATKRGVEVGGDGRVWGLVSVHHWCGNDPVREHIVRVDLSEMMTFLHVGEPTGPVHEAEFTASEPGGRFTDWGWNVGEFLMFQSWRSTLNPTR